MWFAAVTSTSAYLWLFALLRLGCGQDFSNSSTPGLSIRPFDGPSCSAPPQPENGQWRLHPYFCNKRSAGCNVPEGTELGLGYQLIYNCTPGFVPAGFRVFCDPPGKWSEIPQCTDIRCDTNMGPGIKITDCSRYGKHVKCEDPVLPGTGVKLSCQDGWTAVPQRRSRQPVRYCDDGRWRPSPVECVLQCEPVDRMRPKLDVSDKDLYCSGLPCEAIISLSSGLGIWLEYAGCSAKYPLLGAWPAKPRDCPWHATLYKEKRSSDGPIKMFICGATIIQANFVMTAAHCVYDERFRTVEDAAKLYVMTGNEYRDYDHPPRRDESYVQRKAVKKVNLPFDYYGLRGNYGSDIALLELQDRFDFKNSKFVSPANWDASSPDAPRLRSGAIGRVAGFGRTETLDSSPILQAITAPYVPYSECQPPTDTADNYVFILKDKYCAGYTNGTAVCDGDSGGGLVFENNDDSRYVMGIVSVSLGVDFSNGERTCPKHALTVYTKVSEYTDWIREVISNSAKSKQNSPLVRELSDFPDPTEVLTPEEEQTEQSPTPSSHCTSCPTIPTAPISPVTSSRHGANSPSARCSFCKPPKQPVNGQWELHPRECTDHDGSWDCSVAADVELIDAGTALVYSCDAGFEVRGHPEVYCTRSGSWSNIPKCVNKSKHRGTGAGKRVEGRKPNKYYCPKRKTAKSFEEVLDKLFADDKD